LLPYEKLTGHGRMEFEEEDESRNILLKKIPPFSPVANNVSFTRQ